MDERVEDSNRIAVRINIESDIKGQISAVTFIFHNAGNFDQSSARSGVLHIHRIYSSLVLLLADGCDNCGRRADCLTFNIELLEDGRATRCREPQIQPIRRSY
jgi:ArsR family metal-binding transcriptional regulator